MAAPTKNNTLILNFAAIRQWVKPGPWRRGYEYFLKNQVLEIGLTPKGVEAKVKGKFKDHYITRLTFEPEGMDVQCSCPLEEKWCKHAVAVALTVSRQHLWEAFWGVPPTVDEPKSPFQFDPTSNFQFSLDLFRQPGKALGLKIYNRVTEGAVRKPEAILKTAMSERDANGKPIQFTDLQRNEFAVLQLLSKAGFKNNKERQGWFHLPVGIASDLLPLLARVADVVDKQGNPVFFAANNPLNLHLTVTPAANAGLSTALHWIRKQPVRDELPLEEVQVLHKEVPWGLIGQTLYPLKTLLARLPNLITKSSFSDIKDTEAGKFVFEELPKLRKILDVDAGDLSNQVNVTPVAMRPHLMVELVDQVSLRLRMTLSFMYGETKVALTKGMPEKGYVSITNKKKQVQGFAQRDLAKESKAYERLLAAQLIPMQINQFQAEGDEAIEVYNSLLKKLQQEGWLVQKVKEETMGILKAADKPLHIKAKLAFDEETISHFVLEPSCSVGRQHVDLEEAQTNLLQGKKYFYLKGEGFVEIPLTRMLQFDRTMQAFDAEELAKDRYLIPTYKAGLIAELVDQGVKLTMSKKFKSFWEVMSAGKSMEELSTPATVQAELRPYQLRGFHWLWFLYTYGLNGILADDMGLGKTVQALVTLQQAKDMHGPMPSLIVCPTSVVYNWINEIRKFTPEMRVMNLTGSERFDGYQSLKEQDIIITSYAILRRDINALKNYPFRFAILDESQHIKNFESQTAQAAKQLNAQHRLALSGTPIENKLSELWSVFDFLMPDFLESYHEFRKRFIIPIEERGNEDSERRLKKQVFPFILRRMKRDVLKDLPPKMELVQYCELSDSQTDLYMKVLEITREELMEEASQRGGKASHNSIFRALTRLRQVCNHPSLIGPELSGGLHESGKFDALKEMLLSAIENGHRILLFSQFVEMLKIIKQWLIQKGIKYEILTGQTKRRQEAVDNFNNDESIPIFLVSLKAGGTGLNLTGADFVIHYDPWWNPAAEDQATDRVHRIGQTKNVFVYRLITRGTVEEKIMQLKERKRDLVDSIISADRSMGKNLSLEDLKEILNPDF